jgi:general secretion pathway protein J
MKRAEAGFTLIEVLVATTVLSLVLMLTVSAMRMIGQSSARVAEAVDRNDEMRAVSLFIRNTIRQATTGSGTSDGQSGGGTWASVYSSESEPAYFRGDDGAIAWLSPVSVFPGQVGRQYLQLKREDNTLILRASQYEDGAEPPDWESLGGGELVAGDVSEFRVSYRWAPGMEWSDEQPDDASLPAAVKIRLKVRERYWPDLVVALDNYSQSAL